MAPEELLKEVGEPVGYHYLPNNEMFPVEEVSRSNLKNNPQDYVFLYTSDQLAAAQEEHLKQMSAVQLRLAEMKDQLAKAEQRVVEACALEAIELGDARKDNHGGYALRNYAEAIRSGEWRKFVKEA